MSPSLDELITYRNTLKAYELDCQYAYRMFCEAVYPIDCTTKNIQLLSKTKLPESLDDLIEWNDTLDRVYGIIDRWNLLALGHNSD